MRKLILVTLGVLLVVVATVVASDEDASPTPAPTKTPDAEATEEIEPEATVEATDNSFEPFTQPDLNVLTGNVQRPNGIGFYDGFLYTACTGDSTLYEINSETGETITYSFGLGNSHTMYVTSDGSVRDLWIPDYDINAIVRVTGGSSPQTIASDLEGPWGIAYLDEESFLVTTLIDGSIIRVGRDGETEVMLEGLRSPTGLALDDEYVYVGNNASARRSIEWVEKESLLNGDNPSTETLVSGLQNVTNVVLAPDDLLYFTYSLGTRGVVGRVDPAECLEDGGCSNDQVEVVLFTELAAPLSGLTITPDLRLFVHTIYRPELYWVDLDGDDTSETEEG